MTFSVTFPGLAMFDVNPGGLDVHEIAGTRDGTPETVTLSIAQYRALELA